MSRRFLFLVGSLLLSCSSFAYAKISANDLSAMQWRLVGPFRGGRALAASGITGDASTFYFGSVGGGVWKTDNAGVTWQPLFNQYPVSSIGALAIAPSNPSVLYIGTGEADMRSDITFGNGVYKSTDGGRHWEHLGLDDSRHIGKILVDPHNSNIVLVAVLGHAYGPNRERGVFRTTDGGKTWKKVLYNGPNIGAIDLCFDPGDARVVYASLWNARRTPWSQYPPRQGAGSGIYKSTDEGKTWARIEGRGLPKGNLGRIGLAVTRIGKNERIYALIGANKEKHAGLYRSDDSGRHWQLVSTDWRVRERSWYFGRVIVDPNHPDTVYVPNQSLLRSTDGGHTFTAIKGMPGGDDYHYLWIDPKNSQRMIVASDQGTTISQDGGKTWSSWYNQPTGQFYHVVTDDQFPYRIYGSQQDSGTVSIASRSDFSEITFRDWYSIGGGESGYIAPADPRDPDIVYGGSVYGGVSRFDRATGQSQNISPWPLGTFREPVNKRKYRFTWTSPLVIDPLNDKTLYLGSHVLLKTVDGGLHWKQVSPDLTGAHAPVADSDATLTVNNARQLGHGVIYTVAPSPVREGVIWAGTDTGLVWLSKDGGRHWHNVTPTALPAWSKVSMIDASHFAAGTAYAAIDRHRLDDFSPWIYRTRDYGKHWVRINSGIKAPAFVRAVREDTVRKNLLFAGTETGVYVSFDDGDHWQSLQLNLPTSSVRDLVVHGTDLVAGTHGRAFWVLDDITPLRQLDKAVLAAGFHLFRPATAVRIRRSEQHDTPLPPEEPHGFNPPSGAIIDYYLKTAPKGPVVLEVRDAKDHLVRKISSAEMPPSPPAKPVYFDSKWLPRYQPLTTHVGLNRYVWNLRYPSPSAVAYGYGMGVIPGHGTVRTPLGPLALPGKYTVTLKVGGQIKTEPLILRMDPRAKTSETILKGQLRLALEIDRAIIRNTRLYHQVVKLDDALRHTPKPDPNSKAGMLFEQISTQLAQLKKHIHDSQLGNLAGIVQGTDREPTQQSKAAFAVARDSLKKDEQAVWGLETKTLPKLAKMLKEKGNRLMIRQDGSLKP